MRKLIGWPLSWLLYGIGHLAYLFIDRVLHDDDPNAEPGPVFNAGFRLYQSSMAGSWKVNDWAGCKVWGKPEGHSEVREK